MFHRVVLCTGSNAGDRMAMLMQARTAIAEEIGIVEKCSKVYCTAPWGKTDQQDFLNQVIICHTTLKAQALLISILNIEKKLGRVRGEKWTERTIDIDILYFDQLIIQLPQLKIPHQHLHERKFVLVPLAEIDENGVHPQLKKTNKELLVQTSDVLNVSIFEEDK